MALVQVTVKDGRIVCTPETVHVTKNDQNLVTFKLETAGFSFPKTDAVVMKKPVSSDFPKAAVTTQAMVVELADLNQVAGKYAYSVTVLDSTDTPLELDPVVSNDGGG